LQIYQKFQIRLENEKKDLYSLRNSYIFFLIGKIQDGDVGLCVTERDYNFFTLESDLNPMKSNFRSTNHHREPCDRTFTTREILCFILTTTILINFEI
jgi:hypothetical protein